MADARAGANGPDGHGQHDAELIAGLLDRDLPDAARLFAQARIDTCPDCASLHADLLALAKATVELPAPARPRDFALTPAMATTLVDRAAGEPLTAGGRLTGDMTPSRSRHSAHDRLLIANLVDRSVSESDRARGEEQMVACHDCTRLYADLVALSAATRELPVPQRPRDFTLTTADAERLRVRGWRRLLAAIGSSRDVFSRPLALGLTTLGLAGLLVATIPTVFTGQASSPESVATVGNAAGTAAGDAAGGAAINPETMLSQASAAPSAQDGPGPAAAAAVPAPEASAAAAAAPAPAASDASDSARQQPDILFQGGESSPLAGEPGVGAAADLYAKSLAPEEPAGRFAMVGVAGLLLVAGLGLFGLRWIARRLGDG